MGKITKGIFSAMQATFIIIIIVVVVVKNDEPKLKLQRYGSIVSANNHNEGKGQCNKWVILMGKIKS